MSGTAPPSGDLASAYDYCETLTRERDRDRWLAGLFAPQQGRKHLYALTAFSYEVGRLREITREPLAGEMRLQWWREAIGGDRVGEANANPVAAALIDTIGRFNLPQGAFDAMAAARIFDLYDDPPATLRDLEGYCGETCSSLFQLGALILGEGRDLGAGEAAGHSGVAYAIAGQLRALPITSARGQVFIPADVLTAHGVGRDDIVARRDTPGLRAALGEMREHARRHFATARKLVANLPPRIRPSFLSLFLVPLYLARLEKDSASPFMEMPETQQWRVQWALWRAAKAI
jgi:15-cis-phytoene synthase